MALYYDTRIREVVLNRWAEGGFPRMEAAVTVVIPEEDIEPHESFTFKDTRIPITFKNAVAQELYANETDAIKAEVRSRREAGSVHKTVYNTEGSERANLVEEYHKYVHTFLQRCPRSDLIFQEHLCPWS